MQRQSFAIDLANCELTVDLKNTTLTLTAFEYVSGDYFQGAFTDDTLPPAASRHYETVAILHYYLSQLQSRKGLLSYREGVLRVEDFVGGGTIQTECLFPLRAISGRQRCDWLQARLSSSQAALKEMEMDGEVLRHKLEEEDDKAKQMLRQRVALNSKHKDQQWQLNNAWQRQ